MIQKRQKQQHLVCMICKRFQRKTENKKKSPYSLAQAQSILPCSEERTPSLQKRKPFELELRDGDVRTFNRHLIKKLQRVVRNLARQQETKETQTGLHKENFQQPQRENTLQTFNDDLVQHNAVPEHFDCERNEIHWKIFSERETNQQFEHEV